MVWRNIGSGMGRGLRAMGKAVKWTGRKLVRPLVLLEYGSRVVARGMDESGLFKLLKHVVVLVVLVVSALEVPKWSEYEAWQVINSAQGKGGSGGRRQALEYLNSRGVVLDGVDVSGAYLMSVNLGGAQLTGANLSQANLIGANLRGAHLIGAQLCEAKMLLANLQGALLWSANFEEADLQGAYLEGAWLELACLKGAILDGAELKDARLHGADLRSARLGRVDWRGASIKGAALSGATFSPKEIKQAYRWELAHYDAEQRKLLGLPPEQPTTAPTSEAATE